MREGSFVLIWKAPAADAAYYHDDFNWPPVGNGWRRSRYSEHFNDHERALMLVEQMNAFHGGAGWRYDLKRTA